MKSTLSAPTNTDRTAQAIAAMLYSFAGSTVRDWRSEHGALLVPVDDIVACYMNEPRVSKYAALAMRSAVLATETAAQAADLTAAVLRQVTERAERGIEKESRRAAEIAAAESERAELTSERMLTRHGGLLALAFDDVAQRLASGELKDDYAGEFLNPYFQPDVSGVPELSKFFCDELVTFLGPFARAVMGVDYSETGLRRSFDRFHEARTKERSVASRGADSVHS